MRVTWFIIILGVQRAETGCSLVTGFVLPQLNEVGEYTCKGVLPLGYEPRQSRETPLQFDPQALKVLLLLHHHTACSLFSSIS